MILIADLNLIDSIGDLSTILGESNTFAPISSNLGLLFGLGLVILLLLIYFLNKNQVKSVQNVSQQALKIQEQALQIQDGVRNRVQEQTSEMAAVAQEKINLILEEYQKFLPYAQELGLEVESFSIEAGVLPQIKTSLKGSVDSINEEAIEKIKAENNKNKLLITVLDSILLAKNCNDKLESVYISILKDIIIDIKLGIPPAISVRFQ